MRILITGASGLLGSELCRFLSPRAELAGSNRLAGWARRIPSEKGPAPIESVDIADPGTVSSSMGRLHPDLVVHTAALSHVDAAERDPDSAMRINAGGTENVARACASVGAFLIAISTDYVFNGTSRHPYIEEDPTDPVNLYGRSKLLAEQAALRYSPRLLIVRVSGLFGSGRPNFVTGAVETFRAGRPVQAVSTQVNSPTYVADLAFGIGRLIERLAALSSQRVLHLANEGKASRLEVVRAVARILKVREPESLIREVSWADLALPARRPPYSQLDCGRFTQLTGSPLRPWPAALQAFLDAEVLDPKRRP